MKIGMCPIFPDYYFFVFPLDSNLLTWTSQKDIQSDGKPLLSISAWCVFQKNVLKCYWTGNFNWTVRSAGHGVQGEWFQNRTSVKHDKNILIWKTSMTSFWIVRHKAQLLLVNRINTDKNFSEAKTSTECFHVFQTVKHYNSGIERLKVHVIRRGNGVGVQLQTGVIIGQFKSLQNNWNSKPWKPALRPLNCGSIKSSVKEPRTARFLWPWWSD